MPENLLNDLVTSSTPQAPTNWSLPSDWDEEIHIYGEQAYPKKPKVKQPRKVYTDDNSEPIQTIFGLEEPAIVSPTEAQKFIGLQGLVRPSPFLFANPKTLVGIEVEVENVLRIDPNLTLMFWQVKEDGSLRNRGREFVTPGVIPVSMAEAALHQLFSGLNKDIDFSQRTSIHVHMDVRQLSLQQLVALTLVYTTVENLLFKFVGNNRRSNIFCVPVMETGLMENMSTNPKKFIHAVDGSWTKYSAYNLLPIVSQGSVEFRHMPGTNDVNKLLGWMDLLTRLKQFVYRYPYHLIVDSVLALNSNSMYKQWVETIFGDMTTYLDTTTLLADMEKPVWLAKNSAVSNTFHNLVETKPNDDSTLGKYLWMWCKHLSVKQRDALKQFCKETMQSMDMELVYKALVDNTESYKRSYEKWTPLIDLILMPSPVQTKLPKSASGKYTMFKYPQNGGDTF